MKELFYEIQVSGIQLKLGIISYGSKKWPSENFINGTRNKIL